MLDPLYKAIAWVLALYYSLVPNLGIAIILLTCTVMLLMFPLTAKQARSMIAMQRVQPEIRRIQQLHAGDKQKQNEEMMKFYQENRINPLAGCFPILLQMPVFFALFNVLRHPEDYLPTAGSLGDLYRALCGNVPAAACTNPKGLMFLGMDLSVSASDANSVTDGVLGTLPYFILVGLVVLTGWYQARQTQARQAKMGSAASSPMANQMQVVTKVLPVMFGLFSINFPSGLVLYFVTSNTWRIGQQQLVLNKYYDQAAAERSAAEDEGRKKGPPPGTAKPLDAGESPNASPSAGNGSGAPRGSTPNPNAARRKRKRKR